MSNELKNDYGDGLLKATNHMIKWVEGQIVKIKSVVPEKNTPRQISTGGKLKALNNTLTKLKGYKGVVIKNYYKNLKTKTQGS